VLPSHVDYSRYEFFEGTTAGMMQHGQVIRSLRQSPLVARMYRESVEEYRKKVEDRLYIARNLSPEERFAHLRKTQPWVFGFVEDEDIANYLGVSGEELSELRRLYWPGWKGLA
jgi:hypothetical protein